MADNICSEWKTHGQTFLEKALFTGQLMVKTRYNGHISQTMAQNQPLCSGHSEVCLTPEH